MDGGSEVHGVGGKSPGTLCPGAQDTPPGKELKNPEVGVRGLVEEGSGG